jgi:hypothetical protein
MRRRKSYPTRLHMLEGPATTVPWRLRLANKIRLRGTERAAGKDMMNLRPQARRYISSVIIRYFLQAVFQGGGGNHRQSGSSHDRGTTHPSPTANQGRYFFLEQASNRTESQLKQIGVVAGPVYQRESVVDELARQLQRRFFGSEMHDGLDAICKELS